jgi:pseudaminic acid biosynthesis-associated protein pseG
MLRMGADLKDEKTSTVAIRVDSSKQIGSGHLMRCLTLAERLRKEGADVHFISRDLAGNLHSLVTQHGFELHILPYHDPYPNLTGYAEWLTVEQELDAQETIAILHTIQPVNRLVVDSYALDIAWEQKIRPLVQEIFVIDDLANRQHDCDILLDQNFYRAMEQRYDGLVPPHCKLLLGPRHALLREEFYAAWEKSAARDGVLRRVLVFYGGSDLTGETEKAIRALLQMRLSSVDVDVVVGGSNARRAQIEALCTAHDFLHYHCQVSNMAELMTNADLCLGAGGTTTWERCFLGLPAIVTAIAENQIEICQECAAAGYIIYLGRWSEVTMKDVMRVLRRTQNVDVLMQMQKKCKLDVRGEDLYLRPVEITDARLLYEWRNDKAARENSLHSEDLIYEEHVRWLRHVLGTPAARYFYILMSGTVPLGQIRLSIEEEKALISYSIDAKYRARGYGRMILQCTEARLREQGVRLTLVGYVKKDNIASRKAFVSLHYREYAENELLVYEKKIE